MNSKLKVIIATIAVVLVFFATACTASAQTINSAEALKEYLDKQPANSPDKPIKVTLSANAQMMKNIVAAINSAGKYVGLNFSGNALTIMPNNAFYDESTEKGCALLTAITIPKSDTYIGARAFYNCASLTSVRFEGTDAYPAISLGGDGPIQGDLFDKYRAGGIGTYTRPNGSSETWTKQ